MAKSKVNGVSIQGVVCAVPGDPINIRDLGTDFSLEEIEKVSKIVGLNEVYRVVEGQTAGDLCVAAAERLLIDLGWERESVDGVIMVTQTPDHFLPATACVAHKKLSLADTCLAFDISLGCSGYIYGLLVASQLVASGACKRLLLLAGDTISRVVSEQDKSVALLFGDAGSATALEQDPGGAAMSFVLGSDGTGYENLIVRSGAFREPSVEDTTSLVDDGGTKIPSVKIKMDGLAVFDFTLHRIPNLVNTTLDWHGWGQEDVDSFLFHQANAFILNKIGKKLRLNPEKVPINIGKYGNTSMVTIPLLMADELSETLMSCQRTNLLLAGFGVGYSWAGAALSTGNIRSAVVIRV